MMTEMVWSARFTYLHPSSVPESEGTAQSRDICCFFSSRGVIYVMLLSTHKKTNSKLNRIGVLYGQVQREQKEELLNAINLGIQIAHFCSSRVAGWLFWWGQRRLFFFVLAVLLHLSVEFGKVNSSVAKLVKDL